MQFVKKTRSSKLTIITKLIIKIGLVILAIFAIVYLLNRVDFPAPIKEIEKTIPNENIKVVK